MTWGAAAPSPAPMRPAPRAGRRVLPLALVALSALAAGALRAQITTQRRAPAGFEQAGAAAVERAVEFAGQPLAGVSVVAAPATPQRVMLVPSSQPALADLLGAHGVHPRAARLWAQSEEFVLDRGACLPASGTAHCVPVRFESTGTGIRLVIEPARRQAAQDGNDALSLLGSAYASASYARDGAGAGGLSVGVSTLGMLSLRDRYFEYDVRASGTGSEGGRVALPRLVPAYNLLLFGTTLAGGARGFAGLFRAGGAGGDAAASQFFVRPRLHGVALRSDGAALQAGGRSEVRITLVAPARVTISAGGVQLYSGMHGIGEQVIAFEGRVGNFVDVLTQDAGGRQERFQAAVSGSDGTNAASGGAPAWIFDAGSTVTEDTAPGTPAAPDTAPASRRVATVQRSLEAGGYRVQAALQATSGQMVRAGLSTSPRHGAWGAAWMGGRFGEAGWSGFASAHVGGALHLGWNAARYRPPARATGTAPDLCRGANAGLCYAAQPYARFSGSLGLWDWPVRLQVATSSTGGMSNRQVLLQGATPLAFGGTQARLMWGLRSSRPGGAGVFALMTFPIGDAAVNGSLSLDAKRQGEVSTGYSRTFDTEAAGPVSLSQAVQRAFGDSASAVTAFSHQLAGNLGPVAATLAVNHDSAGAADFNAAGAVNYGVSGGNFALTREEPGSGYGSFAPSAMAALKIVNDSLDRQTVVLGMRTVEMAPQSSLLLAVPAGYAPDVSIAPGPVAQAAQSAMPDYLFPGNIKEIRVRRGNWFRVRFTRRADGEVLRMAWTREGALAPEERLYPDSRGYAFVFEPAPGRTLTRIVSPGTGTAQGGWRCEAEVPPLPADAAVYPELDYLCDPADAPRR